MAASAGFYNKLYKVQEACPRVDKKATGQKNNKFAPLDEIMDKITPALKNQQLGIFHYLKQGESNTTLFCTQIYDKETSESVISTFPVAMPTMPDSVQKISPIMQGVGAISTYVKRYNISLLLNLIGTDPDKYYYELLPRLPQPVQSMYFDVERGPITFEIKTGDTLTADIEMKRVVIGQDCKEGFIYNITLTSKEKQPIKHINKEFLERMELNLKSTLDMYLPV